MVWSLTLCFLAVSATDVRSASRRIATICSSLNRLFLTGSSCCFGSHLSRNYWLGKTGQVKITPPPGHAGRHKTVERISNPGARGDKRCPRSGFPLELTGIDRGGHGVE